MKYAFPIGEFGGQGGAPYSHEDGLKAAGLGLGAGPGSSRLSGLHVEAWGSARILSHHNATYTCIKDPSKTFITPGQGSIKAPPGTDFVIPGDSRVARVCASYGDRAWMSGGICLEFLEIETAPVEQAGQNAQESVGTCVVDAESRADAGSHLAGMGGTCKVVHIPDGMTLAGIEGKAGDSWDQVSLLVCPWLPMGGKWDCHMHKHLLAPFRQQARTLLLCLQQLQASRAIRPLDQGLPAQLVAALFDVTFFSDDQPSTRDSQQAGSTTRQQVAAGAGRRPPSAAPPAAAAPPAQQDYIQVSMQQEVSRAMQDSEGTLSFRV